MDQENSAIGSAPDTLPEIFEVFDDARRAGFIAAMEFKQNGGKLAGCLCSYTPLELLDAAGIAAVGLCGMSNETVPDAEAVLPKNLCPLIKGTYGFALTQKCPYTYFSDLIIGETTCDGKKKMYELLNEIKPTYVLHLPQSQKRAYASDIWREEVGLLKKELERRFDVEITDDVLRDAVRLRNRARRAFKALYALQENVPPAMSGVEMMTTLLKSTFSFDIEQFVESVERLAEERMSAYEEGERPVPASSKRVMLTGCPSGGVIQKVGMTVERNGGAIVCLDDCSGERTQSMLVDEDADDILKAISDRYLAVNCSVMTPNEGRLDNTLALVEKYQVEGVIEVVLQACHTFNVESTKVAAACEERDIPYLKVETDYSSGDLGQIETRIAAFIEML
ncbi:double-cubane-cluster-containing anaerobic reductase [Slackia piriformis]|uniref:double-cubane-cluster-containing anaerobic reductase n=1 Tax=Slackia piriformis TaxID=626934 RepID=UPI0026DD70F2|nr:double-cubane-cluster-containing anaerobic reductase [Slackia piriformis]MDO5023247.1 double-cubane-cluster-containing anaerobic reductase [Slackia piriformis]